MLSAFIKNLMKVYLTVSLKAGRKYNESKKKAQVNTVYIHFLIKRDWGECRYNEKIIEGEKPRQDDFIFPTQASLAAKVTLRLLICIFCVSAYGATSIQKQDSAYDKQTSYPSWYLIVKSTFAKCDATDAIAKTLA